MLFKNTLKYIEKLPDEQYPEKCFNEMISIKRHNSGKQNCTNFRWLNKKNFID